MNDQWMFTNPRLTLSTMDTYIIRSSILAALKQASAEFSGTVLDVGCGRMPYREMVLSSGRVDRYIGLDLENNDVYRNKPDLAWDGKNIPLAVNSVDCVMATELFEHCPEPEEVMSEICRVLRPGGLLFFTVPFLWPLHDVPYDQYRYTPFALERHLENAGFAKVLLHSSGGWDQSLAQMIGLYARRRPMPGLARLFISILAFPLVYLLSKFAGMRWIASREGGFQESSMIIGLSGIAYKP